MAAKTILALFALLAISVSADAASKSYYPRYLTPSTTAVGSISIPCVQYATLEQVLASGATSPSSAIALEGPLAVLRQQCLTDILQQGATSLPGQQQAPSVAQQQIVQQQLLPFLQQQALLIQQLQQQQQQVLLPYLSNDILATANPAGFYGYGQQQQLPYYGQEDQLFPSTLNAFSAVNPAAAYEQQQLFSYLSNTLAATNPAAFRQPFSAGARF